MKSRGLLLGLLITPLCWGWSSSAPVLKNDQPPLRTISLPGTVDASAWARAQGLGRLRPIGGEGTRQLLSFRADEARWQQLQHLCQNDDPLAPQCATDSCQGIRSPRSGLDAAGQSLSSWLVPRPPDLNTFLAGRPDSCPNGRRAQPWQGQLPNGQDPACWSLQQLQPCRSEQTPAEYLAPHWRPNQLVVALADKGIDSHQWAANLGLMLLEETRLASTGDRLLRLLRPHDSPTSLDAWVTLLGGLSNTLGAQKDLAYFTLAEPTAPWVSGVSSAPPSPGLPAPPPAPLDPLQGLNYGPALTRADQLMSRLDGRDVAVAVIDTGVDRQHPELQQRVSHWYDFSGRGYSSDAHGTAVAAIIAAARGNGLGAAGLAPAVTLHSYKACHPREHHGLAAQCWSSSLIKALDHAISHNLPVINMSLGGPPSPLLQRLIRAAQQRGLLVLAAAGNGGPNARPVYPAAWPEALAITAVDPDQRRYAQANLGDYIQLAAPGVDIITAAPNNGYPLLSGTSMATAHASGVAALLVQLNPAHSPQGLAPLLQQFSQDLGQPGADDRFGAGLINACSTALALGATGLDCGDAP